MFELQNVIKTAEKFAKDYGIQSNMSEFIDTKLVEKANEMNEIILPVEKLDDKNYIPCFAPWYAINIDAHGIAMPCSQFNPKNGVDINQKSLEKIWYGKLFDKIRKNMKNKKLPVL